MKPTTYTLRVKFKLSGGTARVTLNQFFQDTKKTQRLKNKKNRDSGECVI